MVYTTPNTVINVYRGVEIADGVNIRFSSQSAQAAYFATKLVSEITGQCHIKHTVGSVTHDGPVGELLSCDFISFNNVAYGDGPIYARIIDAEFVNHRTSTIYFKIDGYQTKMFQAKYMASIIGREHLSEADHISAVADPLQEGILELGTSEDLPLTDDMEVIYKHDKGIVTQWGQSSSNPTSTTWPFEPSGVAGLTSQFGSDDYASSDGCLPFIVVVQLSKFAGMADKLAEMQGGLEGASIAVRVIRGKGTYVNNFARAFDLLGLEADAGDELEITRAIDFITDFLAAQGLDDQIMAMWPVPRTQIYRDSQWMGVDTPLPGSQSTTEIVSVRLKTYSECVGFEPHSPKLYRSPFRLLRATSPDGNVHNYSMELFRTDGQLLPADDGAFNFFLYYNFDGIPNQTLIPIMYNGESLGYNERMSYDMLTQIGYITDAWLTYTASVYQQAITNDTGGSRAWRTALGGVPSKAGEVLGALPKSAGQLLSGDVGGIAGNAMDIGRDSKIIAEAYASRNGGGIQRKSSPLDDHQSAYLNDKYTPGNSAGSLAIRTLNNWWSVTQVTLQSTYLKVYDEYFIANGYKSGRLGIPRVLAGPAPHYVSYDGMVFTFVKTDGLNVYGIPKMFADDIASLFDNGCRFINGG